MLAHEQFTVPQLAELGAAAEQASFDFVATSTTSSHGRLTKAIQALTELFNSGATHVNIHSGQADQRRVIDFYGQEVLPR